MSEEITLTKRQLAELLTVASLATNPDLLPEMEEIANRFYNDISGHKDINVMLGAYKKLLEMSKK